MTTLVIARHGNTFSSQDTPTRVGKHTDLPLVEKGIRQGQAIGRYLKDHDLLPDAVYSSTLQRTPQTAQHALDTAKIKLPIYALDIFDEIDYGPDENKIEKDVIARIGQEAITHWDKHAIVPNGWNVNPQTVINNWNNFAHQITKTHDTVTNQVMDINETILVVTSNGIARFAPHITGDFEQFSKEHPIKLSTGALGIMQFSDGKWQCTGWNIKPEIEQ